MRNIFDQYSQNENRLTHAFASALHEDSELRADFINRFLSRGVKPRIGSIRIAEQSYPGYPQMSEQDAESASIPDIWLYDEDNAWCAVVECKITAPLKSDQVRRHIATARRRGFETILPVTISIAVPLDVLPSGTMEFRWSMIYEWLHEHARASAWAKRAAAYFEILEAQMVEAGQLDDFERAEVLLPPKSLLEHFHEASEPNFRLIRKLDQQNQKLAQARDLLLPRLMNGEIAV